MASSVAAASDPMAMLNAQLASALSTTGDAQYWEENISPNTIRTSLSSADPSNPNSTPALLKAMKWLLASISKGRDVSDFYPHVVKTVGANSLEVRKMVYMYLVQYADHDATTRELSLLSINSFQRGLADSEQLIRALALRVLTSIRIPDILQIQILGVQKCAKDNSPYVRKCAANALAKLSPRCDEGQLEMLLEIMQSLLDDDASTMVLTSVVVAFTELCPDRLEFLHGCFRKVCHLLTDMDEWGQVMVVDTMARYCRKFFKEPRAWKQGTAEKIDRERRVRRTLSGIANETNANANANNNNANNNLGDGLDSLLQQTQEQPPPDDGDDNEEEEQEQHQPSTGKYSDSPNKKPSKNKRAVVPKKVKKRVVKKGFYSDEEDESTDEEHYEDPSFGGTSSTLAGAMRQRHFGGAGAGSNSFGVGGSSVPVSAINEEADEDEELNEDHRLLLRSSMPLLKSRNSGVVLAVCSLQYYCGVSSVKVRSSIGKALVRIHRDRREIQYVVLSSIRTLVHECPSAFAPFLQDFFVMAMDPAFTRIIKLEILTALALEPASIEAVLNELRTYVRHGDKAFACASIRAVGTVAELARIVHDRHGAQTGDQAKERGSANRIALNCLHGLAVLTKASDNSSVVGECVVVMQCLLLQLSSGDSSVAEVDDPNHVLSMALQRIVLLLANSLTLRSNADDDEEDDGSDDENEPDKHADDLKKTAGVDLPSAAFAAALWIVGEWASPMKGRSISDSPLRIQQLDDKSFSNIRVEICRLLTKSFTFLDSQEKEQAINFATKVIVSSKCGGTSVPREVALCESILAMGRLEVIPDVRDRARYESSLLHLATSLQFDQDGVEPLPSTSNAQKPSLDNLNRIFLQSKPASSSLPLEDVHYKQRANMGESGGEFRFGTLSSLVGHRARSAYIPLPHWAAEDSSSAVREPQKKEAPTAMASGINSGQTNGSGFYDKSDDSGRSSSDSDSDSGSSSSSSSGDDSSYDGDSGSDSSDDSNSGSEILLPTMPSQPFTSQTPIMDLQSTPQQLTNGGLLSPGLAKQPHSSEESSSNSSDSESDSETSTEADQGPSTIGRIGSLIPMGGPSIQPMAGAGFTSTTTSGATASSVVDDLRGLVLEPVVVDADASGQPNLEKDSSPWFDFIRAGSGGISVKARYLRGKTKVKESQLIGLETGKASTVCLQIRFENKRMDGSVIRHLRILQRSSTASSSQIGPKKVIVPGEIAALKQGQMSSVMLGIDFTITSDRDDSLVARFEIKFGGGTFPVEVRPSLLQLLQPCQKSRSDFDAGMQKLQGFNRVDSSFAIQDSSFLTTSWLRKHGNLTPVEESNINDGNDGMRFAGCLPASGDPIFALITCTSGGGKITVCCEHALAVNGILNSLKKAIAEAST